VYVKIFAQILDSTIARNTRLRRFFMDLLLLADREGHIVMPKDAIAHRLRVDIEEVEWGITELMKPDPESKNAILDGRRLMPIEDIGYGWRVVNYDLYRGLKDADELRQGTRERVARHRARKALERKGNLGNQRKVEAEPCNSANTMNHEVTKSNNKQRQRQKQMQGIPLTRDTGPTPAEEGQPELESGEPRRPQTMRPNRQQAQRFFATKGFKSDPETFFNHYEAVGWTDPQGRPIVNWRALAVTWEKREPSMIRSGAGRVKRGKPATDYEADLGALAEEAEALRARKGAKEGS
jgi:hypothetical protein